MILRKFKRGNVEYFEKFISPPWSSCTPRRRPSPFSPSWRSSTRSPTSGRRSAGRASPSWARCRTWRSWTCRPPSGRRRGRNRQSRRRRESRRGRQGQPRRVREVLMSRILMAHQSWKWWIPSRGRCMLSYLEVIHQAFRHGVGSSNDDLIDTPSSDIEGEKYFFSGWQNDIHPLFFHLHTL